MSVTIVDLKEKSKSLARRVLENRELFPAMLILVVGVVSFGLGRLSVHSVAAVPKESLLSSTKGAQAGPSEPRENREDNKVVQPLPPQTAESEKSHAMPQVGNNTATGPSDATADTTGTREAPAGEKTYVGSKNSNKYHLPWCSGAARIAEENKVWFASKEEAAAAGYTPAGNCKGI